ncbi:MULTISPECIES: putative quinol monooxygenase [unclassified Novosphingobium]|uniref:putative quinol monooxygenase n=1 Tax=unclassified Novosphingobium TaxID=2644732 RepID=UPI0013593BDE|nr:MULTISPECIES: putative quinol monooxygenase [unclassified Novosphingobium]
MIVLAGHLKTAPELVEELADALRSLVAATLKEDGCLGYHFAVDSREQGTVLAYERWRDEDALAVHLGQPAVQALLGGWADRIDTAGVRKFDALNERSFAD